MWYTQDNDVFMHRTLSLLLEHYTCKMLFGTLLPSLAEPDRCNRPRAEGALINGLVYLAQRTRVKLRESGKTNQIAPFVIIT